MRVLCDVHVPHGLVSRLRQMGVHATHVNHAVLVTPLTHGILSVVQLYGDRVGSPFPERSGLSRSPQPAPEMMRSR